jgi:AcrR family transcriptional regulator
MKSPSLRRQPCQDRGRQRIDRILDAAAEAFAEVGYDVATTNAIAARARTSIGSLYQFFPNKHTILHAVAARYLEQLRAVHDRLITPEVGRLPLLEMVARVVDGLAAFHEANPGFQPLFFGSTTSIHLATVANELLQECIGRVEAMLAAHAPEMPPAQRSLQSTVCATVVKALLPLAAACKPTRRKRILKETKYLLFRYMDPVEPHARAQAQP